MTTMLAWHGRAGLKAEVVARMKAHRAADDFIQGHYQIADTDSPLGYRGCALGCTLPKIEGGLPRTLLEEVELQYGIHRHVADLIEDIFEGVDEEDAGDFAVAVIKAIPVGADLSRIVERLDDFREYPEPAPFVHRSDEPFDGPYEARDWLLRELAAAPVPAVTR